VKNDAVLWEEEDQVFVSVDKYAPMTWGAKCHRCPRTSAGLRESKSGRAGR